MARLDRIRVSGNQRLSFSQFLGFSHFGSGWGGWIRTTTVCINSAASYQLDHAPKEALIIMRESVLISNPSAECLQLRIRK
jgi:hypothetical protein